MLICSTWNIENLLIWNMNFSFKNANCQLGSINLVHINTRDLTIIDSISRAWDSHMSWYHRILITVLLLLIRFLLLCEYTHHLKFEACYKLQKSVHPTIVQVGLISFEFYSFLLKCSYLFFLLPTARLFSWKWVLRRVRIWYLLDWPHTVALCWVLNAQHAHAVKKMLQHENCRHIEVVSTELLCLT